VSYERKYDTQKSNENYVKKILPCIPAFAVPANVKLKLPIIYRLYFDKIVLPIRIEPYCNFFMYVIYLFCGCNTHAWPLSYFLVVFSTYLRRQHTVKLRQKYSVWQSGQEGSASFWVIFPYSPVYRWLSNAG
jgi:hypothetical protein